MDDQTLYPSAVPREVPSHARVTTLQKAEILRGVEIFSNTTVEELFQLASIAREADFTVGQIIFREDDVGDALYLLVEGEVDLTSRKEGFRALVRPRQAFGLYSVLTREPRFLSAKALQDSFVLWIGAEDFYSLLSSNMEIVVGLFKHFVRKCSLHPGC